MPRILTVGQSWTPAPLASTTQCQGKLVERLTQFTTKGGTSYNDVIHVYATYLDSSGVNLINENKISISGDLYFANGIGLVEFDVDHYEYLNFDEFNGNGFAHQTLTGTVWRKN